MSRHRRAGPIPSTPPAAESGKRRTVRAQRAVVATALLACALYLAYRAHSSRTSATAGLRPSPPKAPDAGASAGGFQPTIENREPAPGASPKGMVWIPGGEFSMGANDPPDMDDVGMKATLDARPIHRVYVDGFFIDKMDGTNAQFAEFAKATGYATVAERTPRPEDFPGAPPESLFAGGVVFSPPNDAVPLNTEGMATRFRSARSD